MKQYVTQRLQILEQEKEYLLNPERPKRALMSKLNKDIKSLKSASSNNMPDLELDSSQRLLSDFEQSSLSKLGQHDEGKTTLNEELLENAMASIQALQQHLDSQKNMHQGDGS